MAHRIGANRLARFVLLTGLLALWAFLAAPAAMAESSSPPADKGALVLRVGWGDHVNSTNPFTGSLVAEYEINHLNYDLLVGYNPDDLTPRPEIATSWESSDDGKVWTFAIREGVKWSDGEPLTANDVAFTFNYIVKNQISGYTMFTTGIKEAVATDDYSVQIICEYPKADILRMWVPIVPEHIWSKIKPEDAAGSFTNEPPVVGSGPFQTVEFKRGQFVRLVANKDYWRGAPKIDELIFTSYENTNTMVDELKSGAVDVISGIPSAQYEPLKNTKGITLVSGIAKGFYELGFNCYTGGKSKGNPVCTDPAFRRALNYAVDKQKVLDVAYLGRGEVATSVIQPGYFPASCDFHWEPAADQLYPFDLERADAELTKAGYPLKDGVRLDKDGKPITLRLAALSNMKANQNAGKLITSWFQQLGLTIKYDVVDDATLIAQQYNFEGDTFVPDYDMFLWNWTGLGVDPNFILSVFLTKQIAGWSDCAYSDPTYDEMFEEQARTIDEDQRKDIIWRMQERLWDQTPYITLVYGTDSAAYNNKWEGWVKSPAAGGIVYSPDNIDSFIEVHPAVAKSDPKSGGSNTWLIVGIVIAVVVVIVIVALVVARSRRREEA